MKKHILLVVLLATNLRSIAQKNFTGFFSASYIPQFYFNKGSVRFDQGSPNRIPDLFAKNTWGHDFMLSYQVMYKHRFIAAIGFGVGQQTDDVAFIIDLTHFDPDGNAPGSTYQYNLRRTSNYIFPRIMVGYQFYPSGNWPVNVKAGIKLNYITNGLYYNTGSTVMYSRTNKPDTSVVFEYTYLAFGRQAGDNSITHFSKVNIFSIGTVKNFKRRWLNSISADLEVTFAWAGAGSAVISEGYINQVNSSGNDLFYRQRDLSLGLRLGIGLFK